MATALVALEGVLKTETGDPIPEGIKLYRILVEHYRIVITSDLSRKATEHWLRSNLIIGYADIYDDRYFYEGQELRLRQLDMALALGRVDLFIDVDSDYCAKALEKGISVVMFASPRFVRRTRMVRQWDHLKKEVENQRDALLTAHVNSMPPKEYE